MAHQPTTSSGRDKLASMREAEARRKRQNRLLAALAAFVAVVVAVVAVMWAVSNNDSSSSKHLGTKFIQQTENISQSDYDKVGASGVSNPPVKFSDGKPLTKNGKPRVVYFGGEFCPFCAMERWSMVSALSRFGTWSGLSPLVSSEANIPSFNFRNAKYTSKYLDLTTYETSDQNHNPLQKPSAEDQKVFNTYDNAAHFPKSGTDGAIPFVTYGGVAGSSGSTYDASQDMMNKTPEQIGKKLSDLDDSTTKGIIGSSNVISAQICTLTKNQPSTVCNSAGVKAAKAKLGSN